MLCARAGAATTFERGAGSHLECSVVDKIGRQFYASVFVFQGIPCSSSGTAGRRTHSLMVRCDETKVLTSAPNEVALSSKGVAANVALLAWVRL